MGTTAAAFGRHILDYLTRVVYNKHAAATARKPVILGRSFSLWGDRGPAHLPQHTLRWIPQSFQVAIYRCNPSSNPIGCIAGGPS